MKENFIKQVGKWLMVLSCLLFFVNSVCAEPAFEENFELGIGLWSVDNGVWEIGTPGAGPDSCHSGSQCAGTVLDGNYYGTHKNTRLISPSVRLPEISGDGEIHLRFWHWFMYASNSYGGTVQLSVYDEDENKWSSWINISSGYISGTSQIWTSQNLDITNYATKKIKIAFHHAPGVGVSTGWYIDDIQINGVEYGIITDIIDSDGDGVPDSWDQCGDTLANSCVNHQGCACENGYTQQQMDQMVQNILAWGDANGDGKIGLAEAINALQITSGIKNP